MNNQEFLDKCKNFQDSMKEERGENESYDQTMLFLWRLEQPCSDDGERKGKTESHNGCGLRGGAIELTEVLCQNMERTEDIMQIVNIAYKVVKSRAIANPMREMMTKMAQEIVDSEEDPKTKKELQTELDNALAGKCDK